MLVAALSGLALLVSNSPASINEDVIVKERSLSLSEYDLTRDSDVRALRARIEGSLAQVCPLYATYMDGGSREQCMSEARTEANQQLDHQIVLAQREQARQRLAQN